MIERLNAGLHRKLTLISAQAGFGKTTLLSEWASQRVSESAEEQPMAWFSLDEDDNDSIRFWAYVIAALQTVREGVGDTVLAALDSLQPPPVETILAALINELAAPPQQIILVLDDYHVISNREIHDGLTFLLGHQPPQLHLVLASRADPPLPVARLRSRRQLTELRADDLRFTPDEAAAFLNDMMGLGIHTVYGDDLYFFTFSNLPKVAEMENNPQVKVVWSKVEEQSQVRIRGKVVAVKDEAIQQQFREDNPIVAKLLPGGAQHLFLLYKLQPEKVYVAEGMAPYTGIDW